MANSKKKGNKAERELCKWFQKWTGFPFTRVPASGGLRWKNTNATAGDIICDDERHSRRFQFSVESKSYKDINFEHLLLGNKKIKILEFWQQACDDAKRSGKLPILFMRYNGMTKDTYFVVMGGLTAAIVGDIICGDDYKPEFNQFIMAAPQRDDSLLILNSNDLIKIDYTKLHKTLKSARLHEKKA